MDGGGGNSMYPLNAMFRMTDSKSKVPELDGLPTGPNRASRSGGAVMSCIFSFCKGEGRLH